MIIRCKAANSTKVIKEENKAKNHLILCSHFKSLKHL